MTKLALCDSRGLLNELLDRLSGDKYPEWTEILNAVFRKDLDVQMLIEKLGGMDGVRRLMSGELILQQPRLLRPVSTISLPAVRKFSVKTAFGATKPAIKIWYLGDNFKQYFLNKTEKNIPATELTVSELTRASVDGPILAELGDKAETSLFQFWYLLLKQSDGVPGILLTNGYANIFYIKDVNGTRWTVRAGWNAELGWRVVAGSVGYPCRWRAGDQVFSR